MFLSHGLLVCFCATLAAYRDPGSKIRGRFVDISKDEIEESHPAHFMFEEDSVEVVRYQ